MENSAKVSQKIKIELSFDPSVPLLELKSLSKEIEIIISKRYVHFSVHRSIIYTVRHGSNLKFPLMAEWKKKMWYMHTVKYSALNKGNLAICNKVDEPENIMLDGKAKRKDKHNMIALIREI